MMRSLPLPIMAHWFSRSQSSPHIPRSIEWPLPSQQDHLGRCPQTAWRSWQGCIRDGLECAVWMRFASGEIIPRASGAEGCGRWKSQFAVAAHQQVVEAGLSRHHGGVKSPLRQTAPLPRPGLPSNKRCHRLKLGLRYPICNSGGPFPRVGSAAGGGSTVDFAMTPGGLLVHTCEDWPCAVCRPGQISESRAYCLCLNCAYGIMAAASAGEQGARALLDDISDALSQLEAQQPEPRMPAN